jgi:hypothetical protein
MSALALLKMAIHARSGGSLEVRRRPFPLDAVCGGRCSAKRLALTCVRPVPRRAASNSARANA